MSFRMHSTIIFWLRIPLPSCLQPLLQSISISICPSWIGSISFYISVNCANQVSFAICIPVVSMSQSALLVVVLVLLTIASAFRSGTSSRRSLQMSLQLETVEVPVQLNPAEYVNILRQVVPEDEIIRWYIARIENSVAIIEVVREKKWSRPRLCFSFI